MITTIYLDMDGVLTDFEGEYHRVIGIDPKSITPDEWKDNWKKFIDGRYFENLPVHPGAAHLLEYVWSLGIKTEILSSTGGPDFYDDICWQKTLWLKRHNIPYHANFAPGKKFKSQYATEHRLLIDDQPGIIEKFIEAGGHGVVHNGDPYLTIARVSTILNNEGFKKYEEV